MTELPSSERFEILEELARDARIVRWRALDRRLSREVLLEMPGTAVAARMRSAADRQRLLREARMVARVRHPRVVHLDEVIEDHDPPLLVLELRAGEPLEAALDRRGRLEPDEVVRLGLELAEAMQAVHAEGVVHRGIAAGNVLLDDDEGAVLMGFTFAKPISVERDLTSLNIRARPNQTSAAAGLPDHLAPEQREGLAADARSDVFGLGCLLFRCLTGEPAFAPEAADWVDPKDPAGLAPQAPKTLTRTIRKCLARRPQARFASMIEVAAALAESQPRVGVLPRRTSVVFAVGAAAGLAVVLLFASGLLGVPAAGRKVAGVAKAPTAGSAHYLPRYTHSRALLIGIDYQHSPMPVLDTAEADVEAIERKLDALGWGDIRTLRGAEATRERVLFEIELLGIRAGRDDQVYLHFAGHGQGHWSSKKLGWLIPADATPDNRAGWISFAEIDNWLFEAFEAKHILVALDCCHSGAAVARRTRAVPPARPPGEVIAKLGSRYLTRPAHVLFASSLPDENAADGLVHSPFAAALLGALDEAYRLGAITDTHLDYLIQSALLNSYQTAMRVPVNGSSQFVFMNLK